MSAVVRLGTCSFADEGLIRAWYPRGVSTPKARLAYYAERFDTVEVDSTYYHLPDPAVTGRWAQRTPPEFTFHVKAHATMTHHEPAEPERAFAEFRASIEPLELSGKLEGSCSSTTRASSSLRRRRPSWSASVLCSSRSSRSSSPAPFVARGGRGRTPSRSSSGTGSHTCRSTRRVPAHPTSCHPSRPQPTRSRTSAFTGAMRRPGTSARRSPGSGSTGCTRRRSAERVEELGRLSREANEVYALFNNNRDDFAPRSATILRGLLDAAGVPAAGGVEPPPETPTLF